MASSVSSSKPLYWRLQAKRKQSEKRLGKGEANVSVRIPKERIKQGRLLQECKVWFVCGGRVFLLDALERRVHFERLSDCLPTFGSKFGVSETARKEKVEEQEVGMGRSKSQRAHSKKRIKQGRPLQECKVWFVFVEECVLTRCFGESCSL